MISFLLMFPYLSLTPNTYMYSTPNKTIYVEIVLKIGTSSSGAKRMDSVAWANKSSGGASFLHSKLNNVMM